LALFVVSLLALAGPGAPARADDAPDPCQGSWRDADVRIALARSAANVGGTIYFRDARYPLTATVGGGGETLSGTFRAGADDFPFTATLHGGTLTFATGGKTYALVRDAAPPVANPLGADAQAAPPNPLAVDRPGTRPPPDEKVRWAQYALPDPHLRVTAWTFVAPADWKVDGGVSWTGRLIPGPAYSTSLTVRSPDAAVEYRLFPIFTFVETGNPLVAGGIEVMRVQDPADCIRGIILPRCRAGARDVRVVSAEGLPKMAEEAAAAARASGLQADGLRVASGRGLVTYVEDGKSIEEMIYCTVAALPNPRVGATGWAVDRAFSYRAERGKLEPSMAVLGTIGCSMRENPEWVAARRRELQRIVAAAAPPPRVSAGSRGRSILDVSRSI
jgi:hypothetical protein